MDDLQSGEAEHADEVPQHVDNRRTRVVIATVAVIVVLGGGIAFALSRGGSSDKNAGASSGGASSGAASAPGAGGPSTSARTATTTRPGSRSLANPRGSGHPGGPGASSPTTTTAGHRNTGGTSAPATVKPGGGKVHPVVKGGTLPTTPPETAPPTIALAYTASYQAECRNIWKIADADGLLWDTDWLESGGVHVTECYKQENPVYANFYDTVDQARDGGVSDADSDMSDWAISGVLINTSRTKSWPPGSPLTTS